MQAAEIPNLLVAGGVGAVAVMQGIILSKLSVVDELKQEVVQLKTVLVGINGDNGINSQTKRNTERIEALERK